MTNIEKMYLNKYKTKKIFNCRYDEMRKINENN